MSRKEYKRYSREFKLEAVRLAAQGERPKAQIARELGIRVNQLRKWRLEFEAEEPRYAEFVDLKFEDVERTGPTVQAGVTLPATSPIWPNCSKAPLYSQSTPVSGAIAISTTETCWRMVICPTLSVVPLLAGFAHAVMSSWNTPPK